MQPLVSIIIPTYNVAPYIVQCIESVLTQTEKNIEIIAIDDASTDETWALLQELAQKDARMHITRHEKNTGHPSAARNEGIDRARGKYIAFVDADDWILPDTIAAHYSVMEHENCEMAYCAYQIWEEDVERVSGVYLFNGHAHHSSQQPYFNWTEAGKKFWTDFNTGACFKMYRRDFLQRTEIRFPDRQVEDVPVSFCAAIAAQRIAVLPEAYYIIRRKRKYGKNRDAKKCPQQPFDMIANWRDCYAYIEKNTPPPEKKVKKMAIEALLYVAYHTCYYALKSYTQEANCVRYVVEARSFFVDFIAKQQPKFVYFKDIEKANFEAFLTQPLSEYIATIWEKCHSSESLLYACVDDFSVWRLVRFKMRKEKDNFLESLHAERYGTLSKRKRYLYYAKEIMRKYLRKG